jgi:hypothetical protein
MLFQEIAFASGSRALMLSLQAWKNADDWA